MFRPGLFSHLRHLAVSVVAGAAVGLLVLTAPAPAAAPARISVAPSTVSSGGTVVFSGRVPARGAQSCPAADAAILTSTAALFPPSGIGPQAARKPGGAFRIRYTVPASTPHGTYTVGVRCGGGNVGVHTTLKVTR
ncbi:MAG: hypothetical protein QOI35_2152 [Cryptosporangiaceae bacterium]|nr:hypothetical protein [Cryptosporangiaceae bacterium]